METAPRRLPEWCAWLGVVVWSALIFVTIPFARRLQSSVETLWGDSSIAQVIVVFAVALGACFAVYLLSRGHRFSGRRMAWVAAVAAGYVVYAYRLKEHPAEAIHFVLYGLLGIIVFYALSYRLRDRSVYIAACIVCAMIGTLDEAIQWLVPNRYWDYRDVWFNAFAGGFVQLAIAMGIQPLRIQRCVRPRSAIRVLQLLMLQIVMLMVSAVNTPQRVAVYTEWMPRLRFLQQSRSMMIEYGHRHIDSDIGAFYSRFTRDELLALDAARAHEAARTLNAYLDPKKYGEFLERYSPVTDPFLHEARVHLFQRDHYIHVAPKYASDPLLYGYHRTVAYYEHKLLERYFGETMSKSLYRISPDLVAELQSDVLPGYPFDSYVSRGLVTRLEAWQVQALLLCCLALCLILIHALNLYDGERAMT